MRPIACLAAAALSAAANATPLPPPVAAMIDAAAGDPAALKTVAAIARKSNPGSVAEIDAQVAAINAHAEAARIDKMEHQSFGEGWSGEGSLGAATSSGNTRSSGVAIGVKLAKESLRWKHALAANVDYQRDNGLTSKERYFAGYNGNYKFNERLYAYGLLSWERDRFAGYNRRFSEGLGLGYKVVDTPSVVLAVEGGPALRQTRFTIGTSESSVNGRVAGNLLWNIGPATAFTQTASYFFGGNSNTLNAETALTSKLYDALSVRLSFLLVNESNPQPLRKATDTTTRVALVYGFK